MNPAQYAARLDDGVTRLQQYAEARMSSRCTVRRKTGEFNVVDRIKVPVWEAVHVDLPVRIAGSHGGVASSRRANVGGAETQLAVREAHFPAATSNLADGDLLDLTAGPLAGHVFLIVEATWKDQATARRVPITATGRPEEWS